MQHLAYLYRGITYRLANTVLPIHHFQNKRPSRWSFYVRTKTIFYALTYFRRRISSGNICNDRVHSYSFIFRRAHTLLLLLLHYRKQALYKRVSDVIASIVAKFDIGNAFLFDEMRLSFLKYFNDCGK